MQFMRVAGGGYSVRVRRGTRAHPAWSAIQQGFWRELAALGAPEQQIVCKADMAID